MALERRNPLPVGRYWVDIQAKYLQGFESFLREHPEVVVEARDDQWQTEAMRFSVANFIFHTTAPVTWNQRQWGYPTKAGSEVRTAADTIQRPQPEPSPMDQLSSMLDDVKTGAVALVVLYFLLSGSKGRSRW